MTLLTQNILLSLNSPTYGPGLLSCKTGRKETGVSRLRRNLSRAEKCKHTHEGDPSEGGDPFADDGELVALFRGAVLLLDVDDGEQSGLGGADQVLVLWRRGRQLGARRCEADKVLLSEEAIRDLLRLYGTAVVSGRRWSEGRDDERADHGHVRQRDRQSPLRGRRIA